MQTIFSSAGLHQAEQRGRFHEAVQARFVHIDMAGPRLGPFRSQIRQSRLQRLSFTGIACDATTILRTPERISADPDRDVYFLRMQIAGRTLLRQDQAEVALAPGDCVLFDSARPYELQSPEPIECFIVSLPHRDLEARLHDGSALCARPMSASAGLGRLAFKLLTLIAEEAEALSQDDALPIADRALDIVAAALGDHHRRNAAAAPDRRTALIRAIRQHIDRRHADPGLVPAAIAATHGISLRYLHKLFEASGHSVVGWIRERRLQHAYRDLADPRLAGASITDIAFRHGFSDAAHFSRRFKTRFGFPPRDVRACRHGAP